mmetsp:Transcript_17566/g.30973  ORF Transcript_17566/g.30973 Transcript_17566/m.30973 type:complete len:667 (-) Transcript_17566:429-2429(-)
MFSLAPTPGCNMVQEVAVAYHHELHAHRPPTAHPACSDLAPANASPSPPPPSSAAALANGRWTAEEHRLFLQGLEQHGRGWKKIATLIKSRTVVQIRTHAQKYFQKLAKARENGESVAGVGMGTVGGAVVTSVAPPGHNHHGSMRLGNDPASMAAAAAGGQVGIATAASMVSAGGARGGGRKRRNTTPGGGTKRRAIGNVVRSAVREGRNVKRQEIAEGQRKVASGGIGASMAAAPGAAVAVPVQALSMAQPPANGAKEEYQVPNPLPAVSNVLDPYVATTTMGMRPVPAAGTAAAAAAKKNGRGRQQMVHTATHGTLPMAALEDAVFRLLTPATGAPSPPVMQQQPYPNSVNSIVDPLAPSNRIATAHTRYHPPAPAPGTAYPGIPTGMSPSGVADMSLLPSWVDSNNPPSWYNDGSGIDTLLDDADCLNWLNDTGDLEETYPPAMSEPAPVVRSSSNSSGANTAAPAMLEPMPMTVQDPTGGVHPSTDSLSFLVDPPELHEVMLMAPMDVAAPLPQYVAAVTAHENDVNQLPSFLDEDAHTPPPTLNDPLPPEPTTTTAATLPYSSATEAVESIAPEQKLAGVGESNTNLMGFPDLDMGDEQAFVSALLENSGLSTMSFPKLHSDLHMSQANMSSGNDNQSGVALNFGVGTGVMAREEHVLDES